MKDLKSNVVVLNITNHNLTSEQLHDLNNLFGNVSVQEMPSELKSLWSNINPYWDRDAVQKNVIIPILEWAGGIKNSHDAVVAIVQGESVATCITVNELKLNGITPLAATTQRVSAEITKEDGTVQKTNIFKHVRFRNF